MLLSTAISASEGSLILPASLWKRLTPCYQQWSRSSTATNRFLPGSLTDLVQVYSCRLQKSFTPC